MIRSAYSGRLAMGDGGGGGGGGGPKIASLFSLSDNPEVVLQHAVPGSSAAEARCHEHSHVAQVVGGPLR